MNLDFTNRDHTDLFELFNDWFDITTIPMFLHKRGITISETKEEYIDKIKQLYTAKHLFSELPLNEGFVKVISENIKPKMFPINSKSASGVTTVPCGSCGGKAER